MGVGVKETGPKWKNWRNFQKKKQVNEMEASNLSDIKFKVMIIRMLNSLKKDIESIKKNQWEMKNVVCEIKNILEGINSRLDEADNRNSS